MAALDFPNNPTLNQQFAAPNGVTYVWDGVKWTVAGGGGPGGGMVPITQNMTLYVSPSGVDNPNNGTTSGNPLATVGYAYSLLQTSYRFAAPASQGAIVTIQLAPGAYPAGDTLSGMISGQQAHYSVVINGDAGNPSGYTLTDGLALDHMAMATVRGVTWAGAYTNNSAFLAFGNVIFTDLGAGGGPHLYAQAGGVIRTVGDYTISGGGDFHWAATGSGSAIWILLGPLGGAGGQPGPTITITGTPNFIQFARAGAVASIDMFGPTFVNAGAVTGSQYLATNNGVIAGQGVTLPGNALGTTSNGGVFAN